jgi:arylsulfatase A-like enzyme
MRDEVVIEAGVDRNELTRRETEEAIQFITRNQDKPFFLIISHAMPGSTRAPFSSENFRGKSKNGPYGDSVEELDWSAGQVLAAIEELGLVDETLVIWTSDNAATRRTPQQGSNAPYSGYMNSPAEGGMRVPFLARWPGHIPADTVCEEFCSMMDLLPTAAHLSGAIAPAERIIDGRNIWPLLAGSDGAKTPHEAFYYYHYSQLVAVRSGAWKLFLPLERQKPGPGTEVTLVNSPARLYNVVEDGQEAHDVADSHPEIVARLQRYADAARQDIGDFDHPGLGERPAGYVFIPQYQRLPENQP